MRSPWSLGMLMIAMGGVGISGIGGQKPHGAAPFAIAAVLIAGGALMFLRRPFVFYVALAAAAVLAGTGALALAGKPQLALPVPPALSLVVGLYLCLRAIIARPAMQPRKSEAPPVDDGG
ncbi:MAG TPA: hypothetical protein VFF06_12850 [Polyangia bacterium]|nr:hypothetical protein [Polyangia bacterium]